MSSFKQLTKDNATAVCKADLSAECISSLWSTSHFNQNEKGDTMLEWEERNDHVWSNNEGVIMKHWYTKPVAHCSLCSWFLPTHRQSLSNINHFWS